MEIEKRSGTGVEVRAEGDVVTVTGYAAVFNEPTVIYDEFTEIIAPGAFQEALRNSDVTFLINHGGLPLARTSSGTLKLEEDARGLRMESDLDATDPDVRRIVGKMRRGDLSKMSFGFIAENQEWRETDGLPVRTVKSVRLYDVSIVTQPAYAGTEIALRAFQAQRAEAVFPELNRARKTRLNLALRGLE